MEYPILFKNVSENYSDFYKDEERNSYIIGFVNPDNTNEFGYIISGGRQYGLSYQTLKGYIDTAIDTAYNNAKKYSKNYADTFIYNPLWNTITNTLQPAIKQNRDNISSLTTTVTQNLDEAKAYAVDRCGETLTQANENATILASSAKNNAYDNAKAYTTTTVNTTKTELTALITNEILELSNTVNSYYSYVTDRMMNYSTSEMRNCSNTGHNATLNGIKINQTYLQTYLVGSVSIKVRSSTSGNVPAVPAQMIIKKVNTDNTENIVAYSLNFIKQSDYKDKYITWYFDTFLLESGLDYIFTLVDKNGNLVNISPHTTTVNASTNHITCIGPANGTINNYLPAFGVNLSNIYTKDIAVNKTSIEELIQSVSNLSMYIEDIYARTGWAKPTNVPTAALAAPPSNNINEYDNVSTTNVPNQTESEDENPPSSSTISN